MNFPNFLDIPAGQREAADVLLLPLPYEGTVSYGSGTSEGPRAIWEASTQIELWDEEIAFELDALQFYSADPVVPHFEEPPAEYLSRVTQQSRQLHENRGLVVGIGGEHSLTPPLVQACFDGVEDYSGLTVVQIDAHPDLRDEYEGTPHSHACAMRRLVERGARVIAVGIRSADREEFQYSRESGLVQTFQAQRLAEDSEVERDLKQTLSSLTGPIYLTIDVDGLDVSLSPATGTPQPGGLGWWQVLRYLRFLLHTNVDHRLIGCDLVETVPQPNTQVNEFTAARLLTKMLAYYFQPAG